MKMHLLTEVSSKAPSIDRGNLCSSVQIWPIVWKKDCVSLVNVRWCSFRQRQMNIILLFRCVLCTKHKLVAKRNPFNVGFVWILSILPAVLSQQLTEMRSKENELLQIRYTKWLHLPSLDRRVCVWESMSNSSKQTLTWEKGENQKTAVFYCLQLQILTQNSLNGIHSAAMTYKPDECAWVQTAAVVYFDWVDEITTPSMYTKNEYGNLPQWWLARAGDEWNLIASVNSLFNKLRCSCTRQFLQNANEQTVQNMKDVWMYHIYAYFVSLQNNRKSFAFENVFSYAFKHH